MENVRTSMPAEWAPHEATWLAWPSAEDLWLENLVSAQQEFAQLCRGIAGGGKEELRILVSSSTARNAAQESLEGLPVRFYNVPYGDIWLRDTGPIFVNSGAGSEAVCFDFNGWGGKFVLPWDDKVGREIAELSGFRVRTAGYVLEGGSIDVDGRGNALTTRQCLLNPNRFPVGSVGSESLVQQRLNESLGISRLLWLEEGLRNDHTDGHVDNIARFVSPGCVVCMEPSGSEDPNRAALQSILESLRKMKCVDGSPLEVFTVPSPGRVTNEDGEVIPASHVNFYISNESVVVPLYGTSREEECLKKLEPLFPGRQVFGSSARAILSGGGAFHCITQQQPEVSGGTR